MISTPSAVPTTNSKASAGYLANPFSMGWLYCSSFKSPGMMARTDAMFQ
ncbi:hypothetical protein PC116_g31957 [Phytophthora cactorum]|nr:hypothetical protein PC116_g31957 [Phytophthora cactorum]